MWICLGLIGALLWGQSAAAERKDEICRSVNHCVTILEKHAANSFDYALLRDEFLRFGAKGTDALMLMVSSGDPELESRALQILFKGPFRYSPDDQRALIAIWPSDDRDGHARVMKRIMSPLVRAAAIDTLSHPDPEVRRISRDLLEDATDMTFPLRGQDYGLIAKAVLADPTPGLVKLLGRFPADKTSPILIRVLRSGEALSVEAAYEALFNTDKAQAFQAMTGLIADLKDDEISAAMALSEMLRARNKNRKDGFYLKFAADIAADPQLGRAGRAVGYDALMRAQHLNNTTRLPDSEIGRANFQFIIGHDINVEPYVNYLDQLSADNADAYIAALNSYFAAYQTHRPRAYLREDFILKLGNIDTPLSRKIVGQSLSDRKDFNIIAAAAVSSGLQKQIQLGPELKNLARSHPITRVRVAAKIALEHLSGTVKASDIQRKFSVPEPLKGENKGTDYCQVKGLDFKALSKGMPHFKPGQLNTGMLTAKRRALKTAAEMKAGWLAGYSFGARGGGLIYYDYETGASEPLIDENILAVIPLKKTELGRFPTSFWVITGSSHLELSYGNLYRVSQNTSGFSVKLHATLPGPAHSIAVNPDDSIALDFVDLDQMKRNPRSDIIKEHYNPPLLLEPNGSIRRLCDIGGVSAKEASP